MRKKLKMLRVENNLTQEKMAEKVSVSRATYSAVETGKRCGTKKFWASVQDSFDIPSEDMWELMAVD